MNLIKKGMMVGIIFILSCWTLPEAFAKGGEGHGGNRGGSDRGGGMPHGFSQGEKKGWKGESTPSGWSHGEKKGWSGAKLPPGLAKKQKSGEEPAPESGNGQESQEKETEKS